jgi:hypothetical protein
LHVTTWIWTELKRQLISIVDDWCKEGYCMDLKIN